MWCDFNYKCNFKKLYIIYFQLKILVLTVSNFKQITLFLFLLSTTFVDIINKSRNWQLIKPFNVMNFFVFLICYFLNKILWLKRGQLSLIMQICNHQYLQSSSNYSIQTTVNLSYMVCEWVNSYDTIHLTYV
jgi:hypothetical protein